MDFVAIAMPRMAASGQKRSCDRTRSPHTKRIDTLVSNAGITQPVKTLDSTGADYDRILDVSQSCCAKAPTCW